MVSAKFFEMQIVTVIQLAKRVLVQLAEVVGFTKSIVSKLPVQPHLDGLGARVLVGAHVVRSKLWPEFTQQIVYIQNAIRIRMNP